MNTGGGSVEVEVELRSHGDGSRRMNELEEMKNDPTVILGISFTGHVTNFKSFFLSFFRGCQ